MTSQERRNQWSDTDPLKAVRAVFERYRESFLAQIDNIEEATLALMEERLDEESRRGAERDAHKLAGALGTFGVANGSRLARELEYLLQEKGLAVHDALRLSELTVRLREAVEMHDAGPAATLSTEVDGNQGETREIEAEVDRAPALLIVVRDHELAERVALESRARGLPATVAHSIGEARAISEKHAPGSVLLDLTIDARGADLGLLSHLTETRPEVPVVVITSTTDLSARVEVARRGGRGFLRKPLTPSLVVDAVLGAQKHESFRQTTVMAVDDDPTITDIISELLRPQGIRFVALNDPRRFWDVLRETDPDLLILDVDMPDFSGTELCRALRNDFDHLALPVIFITAKNDSDTVADAFAAGADDFMPKPIVAPELLARMTGRLDRTHLLRSLTESDMVTGLATRRKGTEQLEQFIRLAQRFKQPLAVTLLDVDSLRTVNERFGHSTGDRYLRRLGELIRRKFRADDSSIRWSGEEFVVGMYGMSRIDGVERVAELLDDLREEEFAVTDGETFRLTCSAGVAEFPQDGKTVQELYRSALEALRMAKVSGGDRAFPAGREGGPGTTSSVDVVIVEDDEPVAQLLLHTLETRGFSCRLIGDGLEAEELLVGRDAELRPRVILLDVDLPGIDGLGILRKLAQAGNLARTKVVMLTARSAEIEVLRAMELGAFDHIGKPFSTPILVQRIRIALGT